MARVDELNVILRTLPSGTLEIEASALLSEDGLVIASALPGRLDAVSVAGMSATLHSLGARAARELERGALEQVVIRGGEGTAILVGAAPGTLLLVLASRAADLGRVLADMARAAEQIRGIL